MAEAIEWLRAAAGMDPDVFPAGRRAAARVVGHRIDPANPRAPLFGRRSPICA